MSKKFTLVIPIAGSSSRYSQAGFAVHKAFLPLGNSFILESIISRQFERCSDIIIICTHSQRIDYRQFLHLIASKYIGVQIVSIESHDMGPTKTIYDGLLSLDLDLSAPLFIHYCDFLVDDRAVRYEPLLRTADILAPIFIGFHPASFGTTKYAYLKIDDSNQMLDLKEKESFTSDRVNEPASTGIYIFSNITLFLGLARELLSNTSLWVSGETYISLCLIIALSKNLNIKAVEVDQFICLGTPEDYCEHKYWQSVYRHFQNKNESRSLPFTHLITAAGQGSRFRTSGYDQPKIFLSFMGQSLIELAIQSIRSLDCNIITLDCYIPLLDKVLALSTIDPKVTTVEHTPESQLKSLEILVNDITVESSLLVSSADYWFSIDEQAFLEFLVFHKPDIVIFTTEWIPYVHSSVENYGFALSDNMSRLLRVVEKQPKIDDQRMLKQLIIGSFWFDNLSCIKNIVPSKGGNGEIYIASSIASSMLESHKIMTFPVKSWLSLGTPQELCQANYWFNHLNQLTSKE